MTPSPEVIVATNTFSFTREDGAAIVIRKDETFHVKSARLDGVPKAALEDNFAPFVPGSEIEQATAAPGEKRKRSRAKKTETKSTGKPAGYADLKQPQLKKLLDERGIDYPKGPVANAKLIELLEAADKASE